MFKKSISILFVLLLLVSCASKLAPLDQAVVNIKLFNMQMKAINEALDKQLQLDKQLSENNVDRAWLLKKLKIEQRIDMRLKRANTILKAYIEEVDQWQKSGKMSPNIIPYEHEFRGIMIGIMNLLQELEFERQKQLNKNSLGRNSTTTGGGNL